MNNIPHNSQFALLQGFWFVFRDGDREIAANSSALTGQERVFANGQLVSKQRSFRMVSKHQFSWQGNTYDVVFRVPQIFTGKMECSLTKDGVFIGCFKTSYKSKFRMLEFFVSALFGALIGGLTGYFSLPFWPLLILCIGVVVAAIARETRNIVINQEL